MRKFLLIGVAMASLAAATPVLAQNEDAQATAGAAAGGATGGTIGFLLGGPIGAIVGGFTGAVIGGEAAVSEASVRYAGEHPVDVVYYEGDLQLGAPLPADIEVYPVEGDDTYSYAYVNNRVYFVDRDRVLVESPGYVVPNDTIAYVEANPGASISIEGDITPGFQLQGDVELSDIPENGHYKYVYINDRPALVDASTRTVIWVR